MTQSDPSKIELRGKSLIGWNRGAGGGAKFKAANPATGGALEPEFSSRRFDELNRAAELASKAFPIYSAMSAKKRAEFLRAIADGIDAILDQIITRMPLETALPEPRVRNEAGRTTGQLRLFASVIEEGSWSAPRIDRADPNRKPQPKPDIRSMWRSLGPVAVFCASNFPLAFSVAGGDTASALAAGNPVIVKAHPAHPGTAELVGLVIQRVVRELGMPEGVFSLLFDSGIEIGAALVKHPKIKAVGFTGSLRGGRALMDLASARPEPIPVYAEMGSTNPIFVLPGALKSRGAEIAAGLHTSVTLGGGQFCTKPGLIFLPKGVEGTALAENLGARVAATTAAPLLTAQIRSSYEKQLSLRAAHNDAVLLAEGEIPEVEWRHSCPRRSFRSWRGRVQPASSTFRGSFRPRHFADPLGHARTINSRRKRTPRPPDRNRTRHRRRFARISRARRYSRHARRPDYFQRFSYRSGSVPRDGAWRSVSRDVRRALHFGRHAIHLSFCAAGLLPGIS